MLVYTLCAVAALLAAVLLGRAYLRVRLRLLLWSAICFVCLTLNNLLVAVDLVVLPDTDLYLLRNLTALLGVAVLLYGLIWETRW
ncbi:MAG TPA: DUF5985 family protein [Gemmatimonadales bacterium]|nr:DUF5985 family protein [Gemmatimonadales bacterium]